MTCHKTAGKQNAELENIRRAAFKNGTVQNLQINMVQDKNVTFR